jgi:exonuclease SbcD
VKIAAVGDLHIGSGADMAPDPATRPRLAEQAELWEAACAELDRCDLVLFCGDAFHRRRPTPAEMDVFRRGLRRLSSTPVIAIPGNHEVTAAGKPHALTVFDQDVMLVDEPRVIRVAADTEIACLPWTPPQWYRAKGHAEGGALDVLGIEHGGDAMAEVGYMLLLAIRGLAAQMTAEHRILMLHWSLAGMSLPNGIPTDQLREPVVPVDEMATLGFTAVVASHIHRQQVQMIDTCPVAYTGALWVNDWGEAATDRGVLVIDDGVLEAVPAGDLREYATVRGEWTPATGIDPPPEFPAGSVVRVAVTVTERHRAELDEDALKASLLAAGAAKVTSVAVDVQRPQKATGEPAMDETMQPLDALYEWCHREGIEDEQRHVMIDWTTTALEEAM